MRSIYKVVEAIKKEVPSHYPHRKDLFTSLDEILDDSAYREPEAMCLSWDEIADVLNYYLGQEPKGCSDVSVWKDKIRDIFNDKK